MNTRAQTGRVGVRAWWRQVVDARWVGVVIASVVLAGAVVVAAAPRVLEVATVDDLRDTLTDATPDERNLRLTSLRHIGAGAPRDPFSNIDWLGGQLRDGTLPESVRPLIAEEWWIFDTPQFTVSTYPDQVFARHPPTFRFRQQNGLDDRMTVIDGALPVARDPEPRLVGADCPELDDPSTFEPAADQQCAFIEYPVFETAITALTAAELGTAMGSEIVELGDRTAAINGRPLGVGDRFILQPVTTELGFRTSQVDLGNARLIVEIAALVELESSDDEFWFGDELLHRPRIRETNDFEFVFAAGLLGADQYRRFNRALPETSLEFSWRYLIDPDRVETTDSETLVTELEKISPAEAELVTRLPDLLSEHIAQRRLTVQVWSMIGLAFGATAMAAIATLARAQSVRRGEITSLMEARGASRLQLIGVDLLTALGVVGVPVVIGSAIAWRAFPNSDSRASVTAAALFALFGVAVVTLAAIRSTRSPARRFLARGALVVAAVAVVALLRRRNTGVDAAATGQLDPTLMLAPVLVIAMIAVIGTDLFGPVARLGARLMRRHVGPIWFVGLRRIVASTNTIRAPLFAMVMATALSVLATVLGSSIAASQDLAARQRIGAETRVETLLPQIPLPVDLIEEIDLRHPEAVFATSRVRQRFDGPRSSFVADVIAIEMADQDRPVEERLPATLVGPWDATHLPVVGDDFDLEFGAFVVPMRATNTLDRLPGVRIGAPTVVVDHTLFAEATSDRIAVPDLVLIDDVDAAASLHTLVDGRPGVAISTRVAELERVAGDPLSIWTRRGLLLAAGDGLALALITAVAATVVHAPGRRRDLGLVTVLGGSRADTIRIALTELAPTYLATTLLGVVGGIVSARLLGPNLTFEAFSDGAVSAGVVVEWSAVAVVVIATLIVLAVVLGFAARAVRHLDHAMMLREGNR